MEIRGDLPCCSKLSNLCFSMFNEFCLAVILASREICNPSVFADRRSVSSSKIAFFNSRISLSISSCVAIADCFLIFTGFVRVLSPGTWNLAPQMRRVFKKQFFNLWSKVKWYNYDQYQTTSTVQKSNRKKFAKIVTFFSWIDIQQFLKVLRWKAKNLSHQMRRECSKMSSKLPFSRRNEYNEVFSVKKQ